MRCSEVVFFQCVFFCLTRKFVSTFEIISRCSNYVLVFKFYCNLSHTIVSTMVFSCLQQTTGSLEKVCSKLKNIFLQYFCTQLKFWQIIITNVLSLVSLTQNDIYFVKKFTGDVFFSICLTVSQYP